MAKSFNGNLDILSTSLKKRESKFDAFVFGCGQIDQRAKLDGLAERFVADKIVIEKYRTIAIQEFRLAAATAALTARGVYLTEQDRGHKIAALKKNIKVLVKAREALPDALLFLGAGDEIREFDVAKRALEDVTAWSIRGAGLHGLPATISAAEKMAMRDLIINNTEYSETQRADIQAYNKTDVWASVALLSAMAPSIDLPRALFRGRYMGADARMMRVGLPVDQDLLGRFLDNWEGIRRFYIHRDDEFGLYEDLSFRLAEDKDRRVGNQSSNLRQAGSRYPELKKTARLRQTIADLKLSSLANTIGADGRSRCALMPFWTKTGRNQPNERDKIFLPALPAWVHGFIAPSAGEGIAELDWSAQEIGIMAARSGDPAMIADYQTDPYLGFGKRAKLVPENATKTSHREFRDKCCKPERTIKVLGQ
jgi:hypothetical protein